jgi:hypothetical protein
MYKISKYSYQRAKELNVVIKPSTRKNKKIDVFKDNVYICSIGDINYPDYPTYLKQYGKEYADYRRELYWIRHAKDIRVKNSSGYYSANILW